MDEPPPRLFERLQHIPGYTWSEKNIFHTTYDNWQVFGKKLLKPPPSSHRGASKNRTSHADDNRQNAQNQTHLDVASSQPPSTSGSETETTSSSTPNEPDYIDIVARISTHALREERTYYICKNLVESVDPDGEHIVKPLDMMRLAAHQGDKGPVIVTVFTRPGPNWLNEVVDFGPAWFWGRNEGGEFVKCGDGERGARELGVVPLERFMDFAIGATQCLEILHHRQRIVHGEIRGDAFHMHVETGKVRLIAFGSGLRTFEHGLTSSGWSMLSQEVGAKVKLSFMSPEQTGRMPAEPDSRTDIYSLGILFWTMLTQQPPFDGDTPMDIIQGVLGRRLPSASSIRLDVPDVIGRIIQKMTSKSIPDRYQSASGLRHDLTEVRTLLSAGDSKTLQRWQIATKDISSFFILPTTMIGRSQEYEDVVRIIEKVSRRHQTDQKQDVQSLSSGSSLSESRLEAFNLAIAEASSEEGASSGEIDVYSLGRSNSLSTPTGVGRGHDHGSQNSGGSSLKRSSTVSKHNSMDIPDTSSYSGSVARPWEKNNSLSLESRMSMESLNSNSGVTRSPESIGSLAINRNSQKFRRKGRCELVSISGATGLGKSCLVQSIQIEARRRGYFASAKFDLAKKTPFGPVLKLLSSLFKQVFSESDTETPFHRLLKGYVRPAWPMLHKALDLPEFLLGPPASKNPNHAGKLSPSYNTSIRSEIGGRDSSSSSCRASFYGLALGSQLSQDFMRAGTSTKSVRLMNTVLDVLRVFSQHKFICFCLDDLQFADDESLDLITHIVSARMKMVLMVTYRPDEILPERIRTILEPSDSEGISGVGITRVVLRPLREDDIVTFVAATLCLSREEVLPLAAVIQSKTAGNPFYMREMLDTCHRKQCIWYDYKESRWHYSLDKIFTQFQTENYHDTLNSEFITTRLNELPPASRSILAWGSLLGTSFSFEFIQKLLSGEFNYDDNDQTPEDFRPYSLSHSQQDAIEGLQAALQAYILTSTQQDDRFRFAHDRYSQAAQSLADFNTPKMHFIIALTLLKYHSVDGRSRDDIASHISQCTSIIKKQVLHRHRFRSLLFGCAQAASESGARSTAAGYYASCFALLQADPWTDGEPDVYPDETLEMHIRAAECYLYLGQFSDAKSLLAVVFSNASTPVDKAPAWILQSRVLAQEGDTPAAFQALKQCLAALDISVDDDPSFEKCDREFERLTVQIESLEVETLLSRPLVKDNNLVAVGAVLSETISAAFWTNELLFYSMALVMCSTQLKHGLFPQAGMGFLHLATIAISRFNMIRFASKIGKLSLELMTKCQDPYTLGRGGTIYSLFVGHIEVDLQTSLGQLDGALEFAIQAGDRVSTILNFGIVANLKFYASENVVDLENFVHYGCEEVQNWALDTRGGTMAISIRQLCRALQGKTETDDPSRIMSDNQHDAHHYKSWLTKTLNNNSSRQIWMYETMEMVPLFLYGHYAEAIKMGEVLLERIDIMWSIRATRFLYFLQGLSLCGLMWSKLQNPLRTLSQDSLNTTSPVVEHGPSEKELQEQTTNIVNQVKHFKRKIKDWQEVSTVNYFCWSRLLAAQIAEMENDHGKALANYEECLDHSSANDFVLEEALGNHLYGGFFLRNGSRRAAKHCLRESIQLYRQLGATGVAKHIEEEHNLLLKGPVRNMRAVDVGCQTDFAGDSPSVQYRTINGPGDDERDSREISETKGDRIGAWQVSARGHDHGGVGLPALDMLDLTSILESSQVISSVLQVDQLLKTMCEIILQNCGGLASSAAIVVEDDEPPLENASPEWIIAASGDAEMGAEAHMPGIPLHETALVAEGVILYCTRFRETVFLGDINHDERFSNVTDAWSHRNPGGKSVIALPIVHGDKPLLGVLYLEGEVNAFTDRNLTVLQLLVNQIGISYSNALTLKEVKKVSAFNTSMVDMQKTALFKAQQAETKAKCAEAEALTSVKLAEEAAKAKSIFLANVSHELRTPLNGVIGNSELLRDCNLSKEQAEMADSIRISADLLLTVINDILDFSKMEADKMELCIESFKPDEMIREIVRSVSYSYRDKKRLKNIEILQDINLPDLLIYGDPVRLHQVLGNLLGNSMKFTETGSITVGARCDTEDRNSATLTFWVKDSGIGIPAQQLSKLFKPFSQADASTARKYGGSGLGLSICKSLIENMMGGTISLDSLQNVGTTASFTVPFGKVQLRLDGVNHGQIDVDRHSNSARTHEAERNEQPKVKSKLSYSNSSHIARENLRICVAEDNQINQKIAIQFMEKLGYKNVDAYGNGLEAVEGLRKASKQGNPYHVVLMDVQMPVLDGYEATKLLRNDPLADVRGVLVIAMTASAIQGDREKCLDAGMNDYLAKPVRVGILKSKLNQYLNQPNTDVPNLQAAAKQVTNTVLAGHTARESSTPDSNSSSPSMSLSTNSNPRSNSSISIAPEGSPTKLLGADLKKGDSLPHRPSVIKTESESVEGVNTKESTPVVEGNVSPKIQSSPSIESEKTRKAAREKEFRASNTNSVKQAPK